MRDTYTDSGVQTLTLAAAATTFVVEGKPHIRITGDAGGNTLATITGGYEGLVIVLEFQDALITITDTDAHTADTIDLTASFTSADDVLLALSYDGTSWYEVSRNTVADFAAFIDGTANQVTVTDDGDGTVTLSTPQNIHTGASPTFAGFTKVGDATNYTTISATGVLTFAAGARPTREIVVPLGSMVLYPDGSANAGTVLLEHDQTNHRDYLRWTAGAANQDIDLVYSFRLPPDFAAWTATNAFYIDTRSSDFANHTLTATLFIEAGTADGGINGASVVPTGGNDAWESKSDLPTDGSYAANQWVHFHLNLDADTQGDTLDVSRIYFQYLSSY